MSSIPRCIFRLTIFVIPAGVGRLHNQSFAGRGIPVKLLSAILLVLFRADLGIRLGLACRPWTAGSELPL
jgi:hypothetical protein